MTRQEYLHERTLMRRSLLDSRKRGRGRGSMGERCEQIMKPQVCPAGLVSRLDHLQQKTSVAVDI